LTTVGHHGKLHFVNGRRAPGGIHLPPDPERDALSTPQSVGGSIRGVI
jgi:hypothetical protein